MRAVIVGTAVLCLIAAQPASAAWTTSRQGNAPAKAGQLGAVTPITCTGTTVRWTAAGGPVTYSVYFANGNNNYPPNPDVVTAGTTATAPGKVNVLVKAVVGSWSVQAESAGKICN
ncbi:hypothetical protein ABZ345_33090 [Lentzea sp. NPDC005914]|uniref:hypothetical protein n=1 Tax=Lentzea sp. NPDC005914 TaxID=3154572 RepID=UPI0033C74408